jgi:hypothetical protein
MKILSSWRRKVVAAGIIVLLLFAFRPGASRLKSRIIASISAGVGRSADIGAVHFRLLPRPGFDLENLVVYDDPAFGAEPMLRASEVTADLRLMSLLRGRLEIARLDLTDPSLNLVHGDNGRWNLEALLERTAHTPLAPTAKGKTERRQEFPYIHATSARINLKSGFEKKPYALSNADFSLWQDSENSWGVRLKAQPLRTDLNLNDTGELVVNGTWQRAPVFRDTPMDFRLEWSKGQLGQLSKFVSGNDQGWRGGVQLDVTMKGTPARLQIVTDASIQDFRRYDITNGEALNLLGHCDGEYSAVDHGIHQLDCKAPVAGGLITMKGDMGLPGSHNYRLVVAAEKVPANAAAALARRVKKNLPDDLLAGGTMSGSVTIREDALKDLGVRLEGKGEIAEFRLSSVANDVEIGPEIIPFVIGADSSGGAKRGGRINAATAKAGGTRLEIGPWSLGSGRTATPTVRGWASRSGYNLSIAGETDIAKTLRVARMLGIPALQSAAEGTAGVDLQVAGYWGYGAQSGFLGPQVTGTAKLRNVRVAFYGTAAPVEVLSAEVQLLPNEVRVTKLSARAADAVWSGSLEMPRGCGVPGACEMHFNLSANRVAFGELGAWMRPGAKERPWYRVLGASTPGVPFFANLRASGRITADVLQMQKLTGARVSAHVEVDHGKLRLTELNADLLGGKHQGEWLADFSVSPTICNGSGAVTGASLVRLAEAGNEEWVTGTASGNYQIKGPCSAEFWQLADGVVQFDVRDGALPRISFVDEEGPVKILRLSGRARLQGGKFEMKDGALESPDGKFQLSGTAGLNRELEIKVMRTSNAGYAITGTLGEPRVTAFPSAEQARLKP